MKIQWYRLVRIKEKWNLPFAELTNAYAIITIR